jgi:hypothetical protein
MTTVVTRSPVILGDSKDWNEWIELIKTAALRSDIWVYINPETPENRLPLRTRPVRPTSGDVHKTEDGNPSDTIKYSQLDENEKEQLKVLQRDYEYDRKRFDEQEDTLNEIRTRIQETIKRGFLTYAFKCDTAYKMLANHKNRFAPSDSTREQELVLGWRKLQKDSTSTTSKQCLRLPVLRLILRRYFETKGYSYCYSWGGVSDGYCYLPLGHLPPLLTYTAYDDYMSHSFATH